MLDLVNNLHSHSWFLPLSSIALSLALAGGLLAGIKRKINPWLILAFGLLPGIVYYVVSPCMRIYSSHGFLHTSNAYQILNGQFPPMNPLLAGQSQVYPWAHTVPVAGLAYAFRLSPSVSFALINMLALLGTLILVYKTALLVSEGRTTALFATFLSIFGLTFLNQGVLADLVAWLTGTRVFEWRALLVSRFTLTTGMALGFLFFSLFLYSILLVFSRPGGRRGYAMLVVAVAGCGLAYPLTLQVLTVVSFAMCAVVLVREDRSALPAIAVTLGCVACGALVALPYLQQLGSATSAPVFQLGPSRQPNAAVLAIASDWQRVNLKLLRLLLFTAPLAAVLLWKRRALLQSWRAKPMIHMMLVAAAATIMAMYLLIIVTPPLANEYKYLMLACFPLGILGGTALAAVHRDNRTVGLLLVASFLIPISGHWIEMGTWRECDLTIDEGAHLRFSDPDRDALYEWIGSRTETDAVFVDSELTIPVFGRRQLYMGIAEPGVDGWSFSPQVFLRASHYPSELLAEREAVVRDVFAKTTGRYVRTATVSVLRRTTGTSDVYVVARASFTRDKLANTPSFRRVFESSEADVFELIRESP